MAQQRVETLGYRVVRRRDLIAAFGGAVATMSRIVRAQEGARQQRVGAWLNPTSGYSHAFTRALRERGWVEGDGFHVDYQWTLDSTDYAEVADRLVAANPDVLLAPTTARALALKKATQKIPIVFVWVSDPVRQGLVASLAHPGGNATGFTWLDFSVAGKALQLLKAIAPSLARMALLFNPQVAPQGDSYVRYLRAAAPTLSVEMSPAPVSDMPGVADAIKALGKEPGGGLLVLTDGFTGAHYDEIARLLEENRVPAISFSDAFVKSGGLASYGPNEDAQLVQAADYIDRILRGASAGDLPVQQPSTFDFAINLKTARGLGLEISPVILVQATEVIE